MIEIIIHPSFHGPSIFEVEPVLGSIQDKVEVSWKNTKAELVVLQQYLNKAFILYVEDLSTMERTATALGLHFIFNVSLLESGRLALASRKLYGWRNFTEEIGSTVCRSLITRLSADFIRKGKHPKLAKIATECFLENVNPIDADVLLRLSNMIT